VAAVIKLTSNVRYIATGDSAKEPDLTAIASPADRLQQAVRRNPVLTRQGALEFLFASLFRGMVYPQIWEDPEVDLEALALTRHSRMVVIASGGCNVLSYLTADPAQITALDLSTAHVALVRLKLAAARHLPSWHAFHAFFGAADDAANIDRYWQHLAPHLDAETRAYWETRTGLGARRIAMFTRNVYRHGVLGRFIGLGHAVARAYGIDPGAVLQAHDMAGQREIFARVLAPLFEKRFVRWAASSRLSLYGLGIPPAQYAALSGGRHMADVLRERVERLACGFSLAENYFAWQAFGRGYAKDGPLPPYLRSVNFATIRARAGRVEVRNRSFTEHLQGCAAASLDHYVLLDAQDWMTDAQLDALWREITRTARPGARVIFRTAAAPSLLPGRVADEVRAQWDHADAESRRLTARDRSAIYGGFHLYVRRD
jgi:S-adenosylmethionine-diacylglycerol 3-amino-3-carboxypropyl transferase